jgi:Flp pilus assembly pilin Flp
MEMSMRTTEYESHVISRFLGEESGASLMEYALIGAIIAAIGALIFLAISKEK